MHRPVKLLWTLLLACLAGAAFAQEGRVRGHGPRWQAPVQQPAAAPGGMSWEERQRLRDELKASRGEPPHKGWRAAPREFKPAPPPPMAPEDRERLRRDIREANRDLQGRR